MNAISTGQEDAADVHCSGATIATDVHMWSM